MGAPKNLGVDTYPDPVGHFWGSYSFLFLYHCIGMPHSSKAQSSYYPAIVGTNAILYRKLCNGNITVFCSLNASILFSTLSLAGVWVLQKMKEI